MSIDLSKASSRPIGVANALLRKPIDDATFANTIVVITGEHSTLSTENGRWCFLDSLTLALRVFRNVRVVLPPGDASLVEEAQQICQRACLQGVASVHVADNPADQAFHTAHAILNVGSRTDGRLPWTAINSNGWVARVSSTSNPISNNSGDPNPVAALLAASLGVAELFKRVVGVPEEIAPPTDAIEFSLFDLSTSVENCGPPLPISIHLPRTLLIGAGAIGNGISLLLGQLHARGEVHIIDNQCYEDENAGTCVLLDNDDWIGMPKARRLASWLEQNTPLNVSGDRLSIEELIARLTPDQEFSLVLTAVDNLAARQEAQRMWPDAIVDGGINEVGASVVQHRLDRPDQSCLLCYFTEPKLDERVEQSRWTGLSISSLGTLDRELTEEDIASAEVDKRDWLRECKRNGKKICSIVSEAALADRLGVNAEDGFRPSVPFVATAAAALMMAEVLKQLTHPNAKRPFLFQFGNLFLGPDASCIVDSEPTNDCICVTQRALLERICSVRRTRPTNSAEKVG